MPRLTVWYVRLSLLHLVLGATFGALLLIHKGMAWMPWAWSLLAGHIDMVLFGWITLLAMGVAYWILPRFGVKRKREGAARAALVLMNGGIFLIVLSPWLPLSSWVILVGRALEGGAVVAFAYHAWPRVKPLMVST